MTPEQLLILAREFCSRYPATVTNYAALVTGASASTAHIDGIPVHGTPAQAAKSLAEVLRAVPALSKYNREFSHFCARIYLETCDTR